MVWAEKLPVKQGILLLWPYTLGCVYVVGCEKM